MALTEITGTLVCDGEVPLFRFSWKWRRRSPSKVKERTHEAATEALHTGSRHPEAPFA
jgi:hypothetical protein